MIITQVHFVLGTIKDHSKMCSFVTQHNATDVPVVVWGLCFGKEGGVISLLFGPVQGYHWMGPQCLLTPPVSASSIYAAVVYVAGG